MDRAAFSLMPDLLIAPLVREALAEDFGRRGDITSQALIPADRMWKAALVARQDGLVAGVDIARMVFGLIDPSVSFESAGTDGRSVKNGDCLAYVHGRARSLLMGERVALNFLSHLSGIATLTQKFVKAAAPHKANICCTRKTTPGLRALEKYAVVVGGGRNHRFGLDEAVMIKDNHIAVVGDICKAIAMARESVGHMVKIEVEVDSLEQLRCILAQPVDAVLLDNMTLDQLGQAVEMVGGKFILEASGGVSLQTVQAIAATGVDVISVGALTNSAPILDIALDAVD